MSLQSEDDAGSNIKFLVALRVARLMRLARIIRLLKFFKELWLLVSGVLSSARTLAWAWLLIVLIIYVFAIFATRTLGQPFGCVESEQTVECSTDIDDWFGNLGR